MVKQKATQLAIALVLLLFHFADIDLQFVLDVVGVGRVESDGCLQIFHCIFKLIHLSVPFCAPVVTFDGLDKIDGLTCFVDTFLVLLLQVVARCHVEVGSCLNF